jgi:hypothetical protein
MSLNISYQGLPIARQTGGRFEEGGLFVAHEAPMPVATALQLVVGEQTLQGKVRRVREGSGAGMLIVAADGSKLPRWLISLHPESAATSAEIFEAEPPPPPPVVETPAAAATDSSAEAAPSNSTPDGEGDGSAAGSDDDDEGKASSKPSDGKKPAPGGKKGGKKARKR